MFKPKLALFGAATGFTLSFIVGLLGGNPFGIVLFRAVLMGILFSGLALVLGAVVSKFLPELENPAAAEPSETGGMVDITLGDQNDRIDPFAPGADADDDMAEAEEVPDFLVRNRGPASESKAQGEAAPFEGGSRETPGPSASVAPNPVAQRVAAHSSGTSGGLDVLPDLEDFVPAKKQEDADEGLNDGFNAASVLSGPLPSSASPGGGNDSETMAKAIRTILTREP